MLFNILKIFNIIFFLFLEFENQTKIMFEI